VRKLQQAVVATTVEILALIEKEQLHDSGCDAVDMALLASVRETCSHSIINATSKPTHKGQSGIHVNVRSADLQRGAGLGRTFQSLRLSPDQHQQPIGPSQPYDGTRAATWRAATFLKPSKEMRCLRSATRNPVRNSGVE
jgi:hypothetical protein